MLLSKEEEVEELTNEFASSPYTAEHCEVLQRRFHGLEQLCRLRAWKAQRQFQFKFIEPSFAALWYRGTSFATGGKHLTQMERKDDWFDEFASIETEFGELRKSAEKEPKQEAQLTQNVSYRCDVKLVLTREPAKEFLALNIARNEIGQTAAAAIMLMVRHQQQASESIQGVYTKQQTPNFDTKYKSFTAVFIGLNTARHRLRVEKNGKMMLLANENEESPASSEKQRKCWNENENEDYQTGEMHNL
ncbi:hypothetical protein F2P81_024198 [Scophthalmus maximus]|uniref:Uncharacterized protein n=1 Tax=Scophthalmus maximus TaxID=52904 RepID=A0A6A4RU60_SCOMX|nr:hypothetical protein F2P81_024198 [Scophthalmus maximus]